MSGNSGLTKVLDFVKLIGVLKATKRAGWVNRHVQNPESVAAHMYRMSVMSFLIDSKQALNKDRCMKLALVHDMAECIVGDITPTDNVSKDEKHAQEKEAMKHIRSLLSEEVGNEIYSLWEEYENQTSNEASFIKDLDKFDMIMQAYEYEIADHRPGDLQEFFNSTEGKFHHPLVKDMVKELNHQRNGSNAENMDVNIDSEQPIKKNETDTIDYKT